MGKARIGIASFLAMVFLSVGSQPSHATPFETEATFLSKPKISKVLTSRQVEPSDQVLISGQGFSQVNEVFIDSQTAAFSLISDSEIQVRIPEGVNPGDAVLRISGEFGLLSYQNLFEVLPSTKAVESKVTIGTFQGYAAVYTKNFKGKELTIVIGDRARIIPELDANYTQNLTKVGVGKTVSVRVFLDQELLRVEQLVIK